MYKYLKKMELASTLPGYLFILSHITHIGENICLSCAEKNYDFLWSMLELIGLQGCKSVAEPMAAYKSLYVFENYRDLIMQSLTIHSDTSAVIYIYSPTDEAQYNLFIKNYLYKHRQCIIISNVKMDITKKIFSVYICENNIYYEKIKSFKA